MLSSTPWGIRGQNHADDQFCRGFGGRRRRLAGGLLITCGVLGKVWMNAAGIVCPDGKRPMPVGPMILAFVAQLIIALMLAGLMGHMGPRDIPRVMVLGRTGVAWLRHHDDGGGQCLPGQEADADRDRRRPLAGGAGGAGYCVRPLRLMGFEQFFDWLEHTGISLWVRGDSMLAFPTILTIHTIGMGFLAGTNWAIALRIFGLRRAFPLAVRWRNSIPVIWIAFAANAVTGVLLVPGLSLQGGDQSGVLRKVVPSSPVGVILVLKIKEEVLRAGPGSEVVSLPSRAAPKRLAAVISHFLGGRDRG